MSKDIKKAKKILVRYGHGDTLMSIDDYHAGIELPKAVHYLELSYYFIGFEDEKGRECEEDGTYLNQNKEDEKRLE